MLAMAAVMTAFLGSAGLFRQKAEVSQIARKYILRMETVGMLTDAQGAALRKELEEAGISQIELNGTTMWQVNYGDPIILQIKGKLKNGYEITEKRVSTAKH